MVAARVHQVDDGVAVVRADHDPVLEHLDVVARKLGTRTRLDVTMLQGVAAQAPETFTELLASPFGAGAG